MAYTHLHINAESHDWIDACTKALHCETCKPSVHTTLHTHTCMQKHTKSHVTDSTKALSTVDNW